MKHTYFYRTMGWKASGIYYDEEGAASALAGEVQVIRREDKWSLQGFMEVLTEQPTRFTNIYTIFPSSSNMTLRWESSNPKLGTLTGTFEIIGDSIISTYRSKDGVYSGTETLIQIDEKTYYNVGISFRNGERMSSWTADLTAREDT